ncbi:hypothetical protein Tco_0205799 [Tanacetum coccineum]
MFVDFRTDLVEELQSLMEVIPDEEEVAVDVVPLATKPPTIFEIWNDLHAGRKEISPYTTYNYKYDEQEASVTAALIDVNAAQSKLVLLENFNENYSKCLRLLYKVNAAEGVNAASEEVSTAEINAIDADDEIILVSVQDDADAEMFDVNTLTGDEVFTEQEAAVEDVNLTIDEVTLAQALAVLKSVKPKVKGVVIQEPCTTTTTTNSSQQPSQDKGKGIMVEEPVKTMKKKDLIRLDEETTKRLQAEFDEEERLTREKDEANVALIEEWDDIQAKIEADHELA